MDDYTEIKKYLIENKNYQIALENLKNKSELNAYFHVGEVLSKHYKRNNLLKEYSTRLASEVGKGYSITNLKYMIKFYHFFKDWIKISTNLNWSHYVELLALNDSKKIDYYINLTLIENLSYRELHRRIKNKEYEKHSNEEKMNQV